MLETLHLYKYILYYFEKSSQDQYTKCILKGRYVLSMKTNLKVIYVYCMCVDILRFLLPLIVGKQFQQGNNLSVYKQIRLSTKKNMEINKTGYIYIIFSCSFFPVGALSSILLVICYQTRIFPISLSACHPLKNHSFVLRKLGITVCQINISTSPDGCPFESLHSVIFYRL